MEILARVALWVHIIFGTVGILAFWVPVFTRKGAQQHRQFGNIFRWSAYVMLTAAAIALIIRLSQLLHDGFSPSDSPYRFGLLFLLGQLVVLVWVTVRHGVLVLRHKREPGKLDTNTNRALAMLVTGASALLIGYALLYMPVNMLVLIILGGVGIFSGTDILRYIHGRKTGTQEWKLEHLGSMLGAGIAYHTAFAVFGMSRVIELPLPGAMMMLPWLLPTVVGVPAILLWTRYYRSN